MSTLIGAPASGTKASLPGSEHVSYQIWGGRAWEQTVLATDRIRIGWLRAVRPTNCPQLQLFSVLRIAKCPFHLQIWETVLLFSAVGQ